MPQFMLVLPILISLTLIPSALSQESALLKKICSDNSQNYTKNSSYSIDLKSLLDDIYLNAPEHHGFWKAKKGETYGVGLCRGDVSLGDCNYCLHDARCKITQRCNKKRAIIWYDYCSLKYADYDFFGEIDTENRLHLYNVNNATDPKGFNATTRSLLRKLSKSAANQMDTMFAYGETFEKKENATIYGIAQCSRDLSTKNCEVCLSRAVDDLPGFTSETSPVGGRTLTGSCHVGYEIYPFIIKDPSKNNTVMI